MSASALVTQVKIICLNHAVGVIVVDEIQNAIQTAVHNKQVRPLIKFLVELVNETCTSIYFIGTSEAEQLFCQQEHLQRRTRGLLSELFQQSHELEAQIKIWASRMSLRICGKAFCLPSTIKLKNIAHILRKTTFMQIAPTQASNG